MKVSDSELRNKMPCAIKFYYHLGKTALETDKLMKEAFKGKCFGGYRIFKSHGDFEKGCLCQ